MILEGLLMLDDPARDRLRLAAGCLRLDGGVIASVEVDNRPLDPVHDERLPVLAPGFVDAHVHLPQFDAIGVDGLPLLEWLRRAVFPAEARWADPRFALAMAVRVGRRLAAHGTTGLAAYATVHHEGAQHAINTLGELGLWGHVGQVLMDQEAPAELCFPAAKLLDEAARLIARNRIQPSINPRFAVSCSMPLMEGAGLLARQTNRLVQTHLSETLDECALVARLHGGLGYLDVYRRAGLLPGDEQRRSLFAHAVHLSDDDRQLMHEHNATIAHCPTANLFLGSGAMDLAATRRSRVQVALGSDVAGGPDVSMVRVGRAMIETAKRSALARGQVPTAAHAWWLITAGNAAALGRPDHGVLRAGSPADIVIIDPCGDRATRLGIAQTGWLATPEPLAALMYGWDDRWIDRTIASGRVVYTPN